MFSIKIEIGRKSKNRKSLGWVNVYKRSDGSLHLSNIPKKSRDESLASKTPYTASKYLKTIELFEE